MKLNPKNILFGDDTEKKGPVAAGGDAAKDRRAHPAGSRELAPIHRRPRTFSLELAGDMDGVTLMARCLDAQVVRGQLSAHYPPGPHPGA